MSCAVAVSFHVGHDLTGSAPSQYEYPTLQPSQALSAPYVDASEDILNYDKGCYPAGDSSQITFAYNCQPIRLSNIAGVSVVFLHSRPPPRMRGVRPCARARPVAGPQEAIARSHGEATGILGHSRAL